MDGMSLAGMLVLGLPVLALHLVSIALTKALQSYSRSLLEERCAGPAAAPSGPSRWIVGTRKPSERAEASGGPDRFAAGGSGGSGGRSGEFPPRVEVVILPVLVIGLLGYVIAGVIGKVFAEVDRRRTLAGGGAIRAARLALDVRSAASGATGGMAFRPFRVDTAAGEPASRDPRGGRCVRRRRRARATRVRPRPSSAGGRSDSHRCRRADDAAVVDRFAPLDRLGRGGRRDLSKDRSLEDSRLRRKSRRHRRHPLRQGLVRPDDGSARACIRSHPRDLVRPAALRAGEQERLRSPRRAARPTPTRRHRSRRIRQCGGPGHPGRPARRAGRPDRRRA